MKKKDVVRKIKFLWNSIFTKEEKRNKKELTKEETKELLKKDKTAKLLDVRSKQEYEEGHLPGAICIPLYELTKEISSITKDKQNNIVVYCRTGARSKKAAEILYELGYDNVYEIKDGMGD